jgi:hypothetical protein
MSPVLVPPVLVPASGWQTPPSQLKPASHILARHSQSSSPGVHAELVVGPTLVDPVDSESLSPVPAIVSELVIADAEKPVSVSDRPSPEEQASAEAAQQTRNQEDERISAT